MTEFLRRPTHRYEDPLARIWIACAENVGFRIRRSPEVYASTDGHGTILIGTDDTLDPDDSIAQIILHELCHALVEGEAGENRADWGLDNTAHASGWQERAWREHACLRLQAWLAGNVGLRDFFAPTTDFRVSFWKSLPADPLAAAPETGGRREKSCVAARVAAWRAAQPRWAPHLEAALAATATLASLVPTALCDDDHSLPSLWSTVERRPAPHPGGHAPVATWLGTAGCADCAWVFMDRGGHRCRHAPRVKLPAEAPACARFEPAAELDCRTCGACCREAYHSVEVSAREPVNRRHPDLVLVRDTHRKLRREGERCAALSGGRTPTEPHACTIYDDRPRSCREFARGGGHCLDARRRVGLSL